MQLENIKNDPYEYDQIYTVPENVYLVYTWALRAFLQETSASDPQSMTLLQSRVQKDRGYFDGYSISPNGRYNSDYEDGDPYPGRAFADEDDWCGTYPCNDFVINPHASDTNLAMYRYFYSAVATVLGAHEQGHLTLTDSEEIEYKTLKNQMFMELVRCAIGNNHFYDFYHIPEEYKSALENRLMNLQKDCSSIRADVPCACTDDGSPSDQDYFEEIIETLQATEHPLYLYKLLVNTEFRIPEKVQGKLVEWNISSFIMNDRRVTDDEREEILHLAIKMVPQCDKCYDPCGSEGDCWPKLLRHIIEGYIGSW